MAMQKRFGIGHGDVFPAGAFLVGAVEPVVDFERSTRENRVQATCRDTGFPLWSVQVLDADEEASKRERTVSVKIAAKVQPVPPAKNGLPFVAVEFSGLTALPYVDDSGNRPRIAWSFRADGLQAPNAGRQEAE